MKRLGWVLLPLLIAAAPLANVRSGVQKWQVGEYASAIAIWLPLAQAGDPDALFNMGQAYRLGRGVLADRSIALEYYTKAAQRNNLPAQANLGILLFQAGDKDEALIWLVRAADRGEPRAQYVLGVALTTGDGVRRNPALAYAYLLRANSGGIAQAAALTARIELALTPADRERGAALANGLAAGTGVPAEFAAQTLPPRNLSGPAYVEAVPVATPPTIMAPLLPPTPPTPVIKPKVKLDSAKPEDKAEKPEPVKLATLKAMARPEKPHPEKPKTEKPIPEIAKPVLSKAALPDPGWHIQLGAYGKRAKADTAWAEIMAAHGKILGKAKPVFDGDGGVIKLQIGPYPTAAAAREICAKLSAAGRACFAVAP